MMRNILNIFTFISFISVIVPSTSYAGQKNDRYIDDAINSCATLVNKSESSIYATRFVATYGDAYQQVTKKDYQNLIARVCAEGLSAAQKYNNLSDLDMFLFSMRSHWIDILGTPVMDAETISRKYFRAMHGIEKS